MGCCRPRSPGGCSLASRQRQRHPLPPPRASPLVAPLAEPLTDREAEVLVLLADARSNAEIATALFIGEATVKTHVSRILQKLGARDRLQAVGPAHRMGLAELL